MKQVENLSIKEVETLCRLYNECRLSVQEEAELEYILLCTTFSSDLINETRKLMGVSHQMKFQNVQIRPKRTTYRKIIGWTLAAAASVAIVLIGSRFLQVESDTITSTDGNYYIAYVEGERLNEEAARKMAEAEAAKVAAFMQSVEKQKTEEQDKVRQFINYQNNKK